MIGNNYLHELFLYDDEDTGLNQLLEMLKQKDVKFIESLHTQPVDVQKCDRKEIEFLIKASALMDYYLQYLELEVPQWMRDERLKFEKPYYHSKRLSDFDKIKLQYSSTAPFRARNVYFDMRSIERI